MLVASSVGRMQKRDRDETTPYQPKSPFADRDESSRGGDGYCVGGGGERSRPADRPAQNRTETCARSSVGVAADRSVGHRFATYLPAISRNIFPVVWRRPSQKV
jgi:hypothetical protein